MAVPISAGPEEKKTNGPDRQGATWTTRTVWSGEPFRPPTGVTLRDFPVSGALFLREVGAGLWIRATVAQSAIAEQGLARGVRGRGTPAVRVDRAVIRLPYGLAMADRTVHDRHINTGETCCAIVREGHAERECHADSCRSPASARGDRAAQRAP